MNVLPESYLRSEQGRAQTVVSICFQCYGRGTQSAGVKTERQREGGRERARARMEADPPRDKQPHRGKKSPISVDSYYIENGFTLF